MSGAARSPCIRFLVGITAVAVAITRNRPALADPDSAARSLELFERGRKLASSQRCADAIPYFEQSLTVWPSVGARMNLAACHQTAGRVASALREFRRADELARALGDPRVEEIRLRTTELQGRVAKVTLSGLDPSATLTLDKVVVPSGEARAPIVVDIGAHEIEVISATGARWTRTFEIDRDGVTLSFAVAVASPSPVAPPSPAPESTAPPPSGRAQRNVALLTSAVGLVATGAGIAFGISAIDKASALRNLPAEDDSFDERRSSATSTANLSTASFLIGAALLATGAVLYLTAPSPATSAARQSRFGPFGTACGLVTSW